MREGWKPVDRTGHLSHSMYSVRPDHHHSISAHPALAQRGVVFFMPGSDQIAGAFLPSDFVAFAVNTGAAGSDAFAVFKYIETRIIHMMAKHG